MLLSKKISLSAGKGRLSLLKKWRNEKSCTKKLNSKSFVHLFKGGGFPKVLKSLYEATAYELQLS